MRLIGLDIGTTGCKAALFSTEGDLLASASMEYAVDIPHPGWAEQDAEYVWKLAQEVLRDVVVAAQGEEISAIGLSVQGEAVIPVDAQGHALRPAMLGMDARTYPQNDQLRKQFGAEWLFEHTGIPIHTINTLPKMLWLKQHETDIWHKATRFLLYEDFIIHKMTGQAAISRCLASRTQMYDVKADGWSVPLLSSLDLDPKRLAPVRPSGEAVAPMTRALAESLGFSKPPLVVTGGHDQACGALGVGLTKPGLASVSTGTAEVMEVSLAQPYLNETLYKGNISVYSHVVPGLYLAMTLNHSGGMLLRWFRDTLCELQMQQVQGSSAYDLILQDAKADPTNMLVLPHFAGSGTPTFDTASKGAILGLTFGATRTDIAKAILEGVTFELRVNVDLLREGGVPINELRAIGGGARSALWVQLKADITDTPVVVPRITEAACWGAALLAGQGAGCFAEAAQMAEQTLHLEKRFVPDPIQQEKYQARYELYRKAYPLLTNLNHLL